MRSLLASGGPEEIRARLKVYSSSLLATSAFFWTWAVANVARSRPDLGVVSFLGSAMSSALLLRSAMGGKLACTCRKNERGGEADVHLPPGNGLRMFALVTHLIVAVNYALGAIITFATNVPFATYCLVFSLLWVVAAGWGGFS
ncbi:hypothetical protein ACHAWF_008847 [Thalassiosira exigua]